MYGMMNTIGWNYGFSALWGLHVLSVITFFTGLLFFIVLAVKTFKPEQLRTWALWLMVVGTVVCLFTIAVIGRPWVGLRYDRAGKGGNPGWMMNGSWRSMMNVGVDDAANDASDSL